MGTTDYTEASLNLHNWLGQGKAPPSYPKLTPAGYGPAGQSTLPVSNDAHGEYQYPSPQNS
jgi:hypothetical protein